MRLVNVIKTRWEDRWRRITFDAWPVIAMLFAITVVALALYGVFD